MMNVETDRLVAGICVAAVVLLSACGSADPVAPERYVETDALVERINQNLSQVGNLRKVTEIDHSRLGHEAGSPMPPSRVVIFSDPGLEAQLVQLHPLVALDLPLRVLAFEQGEGGPGRVIYNNFDYLVSRYGLDAGQTSTLGKRYARSFSEATRGVPNEGVSSFENDMMQPDGIVTITSPYDFDETLRRVNAAIDAQDDTMHFGKVDFQALASKQGIEVPPSQMILFGAPGPGGKVMASAVTLGLDGFCQKFLVWQDRDGRTHLSFNDLVALAERQGARKSIALRVVNFRLKKTFKDALARN